MRGVVLVVVLVALVHAQQDPASLLQSLQSGPMQFIKSHPIPQPHQFASTRPLAPQAPAAPQMPPTTHMLPNLPISTASTPMMFAMLSLPAVIDNPSRLLSGLAMAPLWDSSENGMAARNSVFGGMNPRQRDEIVHQNLLSFVMARDLISTMSTTFTSADPRNGVLNWFDPRPAGQKPTGVL